MSLLINNVDPTDVNLSSSPSTNIDKIQYEITGANLTEATRTSVSSYSVANLNNYKGLVSDTWGGITNASTLVADHYYYIRVLVTDTNRYGKFCVKFKSYNGQTITVDNMGWGYDGDVIYNTYVWSKPANATISSGTYKTSINRTSSPYNNSKLGYVSVGDLRVGDKINISITPDSGYYIYEIAVNGVGQLSTYSTGRRDINLTATENMQITVTTKKTFTLKTPKNNWLTGAHLNVYSRDRNNSGKTLIASEKESATILEGERLYCSTSSDYTAYTVARVDGIGTSLTSYTTVSGDINCEVLFKIYDQHLACWTGKRQSDWIRNNSKTVNFYKSDTTSSSIVWGGSYYTSPSGNIPRVKCVGWCTFGSKSNQSASSGDKTLSVIGGWSGTLRHASWNGSFSMNVSISGTTGTMTTNGSSMGSYYGIGYIKSWSAILPRTSRAYP